MDRLDAAWKQTFADLGVPRPPEAVFADIRARYGEAHRAYHTLQHLEECFALFGEARPLMRAPGEIAFALFYHDAIYDTHAGGNEERSADLALDVLGAHCQVDSGIADRVKDLILVTKHDAVPEDADAAILVDIDLAILGAPAPRFAEYETQVRREYGWVSEENFRTGRARILQQFLDRPTIYTAAHFQERLEASARANLAQSLKQLGA